MKVINFDNPHRRKHYEFFKNMNHPHFNITAPVDVTKLIPFIKKNQLHMTYSLVHWIAAVANAIREFRWRIRGEDAVEHEVVHPSFTVPTDNADVFSFCTVDFTSDARTFLQKAERANLAMKDKPSIEDEAGRDDYLFLSAIPWVSFTSMQHAMHYHPSDSVPRISWGKFYAHGDQTLIPISVQVHHALVDGRHVGAYFQQLEALAQQPQDHFSN